MADGKMRAPPAGGEIALTDRNIRVATALFMAMIAYGSLYPFAFHEVPDGIGPIRTLISRWNKPPGQGDFISNILLYMPLGFSGSISVGRRASLAQMGTAILLGAGLSLSMEIAQYWDMGRDTEATDFYANTIGTMLGAFAGWFLGQDFEWPLKRELSANKVPALLLMAWLGYRLYPYVPMISLHKYTGALTAIFLRPDLTSYGVFRQTAVWLAIRAMLERIGGPALGARLFWRFAALIFFSSVLIISTWISLSQIVGLILAGIVWATLAPWRGVPVMAASVAMTLYLPVFRLAPFNFADEPNVYGWVPFFSFMQGSIDNDVQAFFEKSFLYGGTIWLLVEAGLALRPATWLVAGLLLAASFADIYVPGRSAEVTDAVLAGTFGLFIRMVEAGTLKAPRLGSRPADTLTGRLQVAEPEI
jgi:glycopeptide antibiotics resistance protein